MRKFFAVIALAATLLSLLGGCGSSSASAETTAARTGADITLEQVVDNFERLVATSEIADFYTVTRLSLTELPDSKESYQAVVVKDKILGETSYHFGVHADPAGKVYMASISLQGQHDMALQLFCSYLVKSLELSEVSILELWDTLDLDTREPSGSMSAEGWRLSAHTLDGSIVFGAIYSPE